MTRPSATAVHEAGHAVVATLLGIPVRHVSVTPAECMILAPGPNADLTKWAVAALAGREATRVILGQGGHDAGDVRKAAAYIKRLGDADPTPYRQAARDLVQEHATLIFSVAGALDRLGRVAGTGIAKLCEADRVARDLATGQRLSRMLKGYPEYNQDQPRGEDGKWTAGGGGGGSNARARARARADRGRATASANATVNIYGRPASSKPRGSGGGGSRSSGSGGGGSGGGGGDAPNFGVSGEIGPGVHASTNIAGWKGLLAVAGTGLAYALLRNPALIVQAVRMARNPRELKAAWDAFIGGATATAQRLRTDFTRPRIRPASTTRPPMGGAKPKGTTTPKGRPLKPASDIGPRQRQRRAADVRAAAGGDVAAAERINANVEATRAARTAKPKAPGTSVATRGAADVATRGGAATTGNLVPATGQVPTTTSRAASGVDALAAQSALARYESLVRDRITLEASIQQTQRRIYQQTGRAYTSRPVGSQPVGTVERQLADQYDELASINARLPAARQEVTEWEAFIGNVAPVTDVTATPARQSILDRLRSTRGRSSKKRLTKAQEVRAYQLSRKQEMVAKRFAKYRPDQERDDHGRFEDEGGGGGAKPEQGRSKWRTAAAAAALVAGGAALSTLDRRFIGPSLRAANRLARRGLMNREAASAARERAIMNQRLDRWTRGQRGSLASGVNRVDEAAERGIERATARLPPKVREAVRRELRQGSAGPDPAGKLIEPPGWLTGLFH